MQQCINRLSTSVRRSIEHEARAVPEIRDYTLYLCGESSSVDGVKEALVDRLGCPVTYFDPFQGFDVQCGLPNDPVDRSCFALSCGAALMGEEE